MEPQALERSKMHRDLSKGTRAAAAPKAVATKGVVAVAAANCQPMAAAQDYLYLTTRRHLVPLLAVGGKNPTAAPKAMAARDAVSEVERAGDADTPGTA